MQKKELGFRKREDRSEQTPFPPHFKELHAVARQGDAREESFYPAFAEMLKTAARPRQVGPSVRHAG